MQNVFKDSFKYYKSKNPPPNLENVLDFNNVEKIAHRIKPLKPVNEDSHNIEGLNPTKSWTAYELHDHPGLIFIKNPFSSIGQRYWTVRALRDYSRKPNKSNLDALNLVPEDKEWWELCHKNQTSSSKTLMNKMRWITLGYHHNWDTKIYAEDNKSEFPKDLSELSNFVCQAMGFQNFNAEAAIINYYHMDSTLSGHSDHSEENLEAPLLSVSFGQTAIFLLGSETKDDTPTAMFLRSGDIVIMSRDSRLSFHAIPKILQIDSHLWDAPDDSEVNSKDRNGVFTVCQVKELWKPFGDYLSNSRININIRQVLKRGQKRLYSCNISET